MRRNTVQLLTRTCGMWHVTVELATVSMEDGKLTYKILDNATVDAALKELDLAQPAAEAQ
jgi:hypothetical protein